MIVRWPALALLLAVTAASCRTGSEPATVIVQPGAPGETTREIGVREATDLSRVQHSDADVQFMQGMIHHHAQAIEMVALLPARTASDDMRALAQRIELSQRDEIGLMQQWLIARGLTAPDEHAHNMPGAPMMPGMLTRDEMTRLADATGIAFDRLFLSAMIRHHLGAIAMVDDLLGTTDGGQETEVFAFTSDVVADQRIEIERMSVMLAKYEELRK